MLFQAPPAGYACLRRSNLLVSTRGSQLPEFLLIRLPGHLAPPKALNGCCSHIRLPQQAPQRIKQPSSSFSATKPALEPQGSASNGTKGKSDPRCAPPRLQKHNCCSDSLLGSLLGLPGSYLLLQPPSGSIESQDLKSHAPPQPANGRLKSPSGSHQTPPALNGQRCCASNSLDLLLPSQYLGMLWGIAVLLAQRPSRVKRFGWFLGLPAAVAAPSTVLVLLAEEAS
mmetsp:Transcript_47314/g.86906  ORF Transcript_47314/g.86906 Transcript_47314/m.86906 type:complete len:227 (+) Transcript_47314:1174-1854(+)